MTNQKFTDITFDKRSIDRSLSLAKLELRDICLDLLSGKRTFSYETQICTGGPLDFHRSLAEWSRMSSVDLAIRNIILSAFYSTEVKQGGSGLLSCLTWLDLLDVESEVNRPETSNIVDVIRSWSRGGISGAVAEKSFLLGSCGCPTKIEESNHLGTAVRVTEGQKIPGGLDVLFASVHPEFHTEEDAYLVFIDGIVESVSQIHHLLENNGTFTVIAARGFLPDVSNTLAQNFLSGKVRVVPYVAKDWSEDFHSFEELGISCVSAATGTAIRNAKLEKTFRVRLESGELIFSSPYTKSNRSITISLGKDLGSLAGISVDRVKTLLALTRFAARSGVIECKITGGKFWCPRSSLHVAKEASKSLDQILQNLGAVITIEDKERLKCQRYQREKFAGRSSTGMTC